MARKTSVQDFQDKTTPPAADPGADFGDGDDGSGEEEAFSGYGAANHSFVEPEEIEANAEIKATPFDVCRECKTARKAHPDYDPSLHGAAQAGLPGVDGPQARCSKGILILGAEVAD